MSSDELSALKGLPFAKMTGSGNDFVFFDARQIDGDLVIRPEAIRAICNRHNGIGADGLVLLQAPADGANARIQYFNSDGSAADLCGNATLCSAALAVELQIGAANGLTIRTAAGIIRTQIHDGTPEIDLEKVTNFTTNVAADLAPGEQRIGFALAGVPHAVVLVDDVEKVDLPVRGRALRHHPAFGSNGANVNFVMNAGASGWRYRTYERGVEGETMACGTGAVGTAIMLLAWKLSESPVTLRTSSGRDLVVRMRAAPADAGGFLPSLMGEGRIVYRGRIEDLGF